jgi:hypothetical protein
MNKTNKLNFTWNNTDWSVSQFNIETTHCNYRNQTMNHQDNMITPRKAFPPRHIVVNPLARAKNPPTPKKSLEATLENARREAAALAWSTGYPFLLQPCLTEELENNAREYWHRQTHIQEQSSEILHQTFPVVSRLLAA